MTFGIEVNVYIFILFYAVNEFDRFVYIRKRAGKCDIFGYLERGIVKIIAESVFVATGAIDFKKNGAKANI